METAAIAQTAEDVMKHVENGYCLVVQETKAFLVEGMFSHGLDRSNVPVVKGAADAVVGELRELSKKEIRETCRPLHGLKGERVFGKK